MMNRIQRMMQIIGLVVFIGLISCSMVVASNPGEPSSLPTVIRSPIPARPAYCVPIPAEAQISRTMTPTPNRLSTPEPYLSPTVTPIPFAHIYDLSPELPLSEKSEIVIFRCNGEFDRYLAGPDVDVDQVIELEDGDIILESIPPASLMGHEPPEPPGYVPTQIPPIPADTTSVP